jgi:TonB family protein
MWRSLVPARVGSALRPLILGLMVLTAVTGWGQVPEEKRPDLEGWQAELAKADSLLTKGGERRAERAQEICEQTYQAMLEWPGQGETAAKLLGEALFLLAVAEARRAEADKARWHWAEAQNVFPAVKQGRLTAFPDVAPLLSKLVVSADEVVPGGTGAGYSPPTPIGMSPVSYPGRIREQAIEGATEVVVVVDESGAPVKPLLRTSCGVPGFDVAVMEAARQWSFSPATQGGTPVKGSYALQARFHLGS